MALVNDLIEAGMVPELAKIVANAVAAAAAAGPVTSVNGDTGVVALAAADIPFSSPDFTATDVGAALQELYDAANP